MRTHGVRLLASRRRTSSGARDRALCDNSAWINLDTPSLNLRITESRLLLSISPVVFVAMKRGKKIRDGAGRSKSNEREGERKKSKQTKRQGDGVDSFSRSAILRCKCRASSLPEKKNNKKIQDTETITQLILGNKDFGNSL